MGVAATTGMSGDHDGSECGSDAPGERQGHHGETKHAKLSIPQQALLLPPQAWAGCAEKVKYAVVPPATDRATRAIAINVRMSISAQGVLLPLQA